MKNIKKPALFILITLILQLFSGINFTNIVKAEENKDFKFITSIELTDFDNKPLKDDIDKSSDVRVNFNFEIPNMKDVKKGEIFTVNIPNQIQLISNFDKELLDEDGEVVAIAHFDKSGKIAIEFTDYTGGYSDVKGNFYLDTKFDKNNIGNEPIEKIEFNLSGQAEPVVVEIKFKQDPIPEVSISKWSDGYDGIKNEITWKIEFNKENVNVKNPIIIDNIPLGQEYIEGSATIDNGADKNGFSYVPVANDGTKSGTVTYNFQGEVNKKYIISFKTKISDASILPEEQGKSVKLTNKAIVNYNNINKESNEASVDVKTNYIEKSGKYDANGKKIDWTIKVNNNSLELNNLKVEDVIPKGLELIKGSFEVNNTANNTYQYDEANKKLDYTFNGTINTQQIIKFSTKVVDEKVYQSNETTNFTNTATILEGLSGKPYSSANVGVGSNILKKSAEGTYNTVNNYLKWKIEVNSNEVKLENPIVTDNIPIGQKYVDGSLKIDGLKPDTNKFTYKVADSGDTKKTGTITYSFNETINKKYVITFETEVSESSIYAGNINNKQYSNIAYMKAHNISEEVNSKADQNVNSNVIDKKSVNYDAIKKEITWKIFVNNNKTKLGQVVVTYNIPLGQEYVENSASINNKDGLFDYKKADENDTEKTGTLTYRFNNEINDTYEITFKTKIIDDSIFYTNGEKKVENTAKISGDVIPPNVITKAEQIIKNSVISKSANYQWGNDYIDWNVVINSNSIPMGKVIVEDNLQEGLELDTATVELCKQTLNSDGLLVKGDAVILNKNSVQYDVNKRNFIFDFSDEVDTPYLLTFRTNIVDKNKQPFSNTIQFKGGKTNAESTVNNVRVEFQSGGGSEIGTRGSITILKLDKDNKNAKLKGAKFNLIDRYDNVIATGETNENGELKFNKIKFDIPYTVEEIVAPEGYTLGEKNFYEFTINSTDDNKNISYSFYNKAIKGSIELNKVDEDKNPLKGVEFTLYNSLGEKVVSSESNDKGIVTFIDVPYGNYTVKETKPLEGYLKNDTIYSFEIKEDGKTVKAENSVENKIIRGNIKVVKVDEDNKLLSNAYITLVDLDGNVVQTAITDANGEVTFTNVPYGKYKVRETKAPEGYNLSEEILDVNIDKEETNELYEAGTITNTKIKANIKINKLDQDKNKVIGAEFTLYNNEDKIIATAVTNTDGIALFEDVVYGDYYIKESKTPKGYIGTDKNVEVRVENNNKEYFYEVENTRIKGVLEISKTDKNDNPLKGAEFTVYDSYDKEIQKAVTDENGLAKFENLVYGSYYYVETKAPEGYVLDSNIHAFEIKDNGVVLKETVNNEQIVGNIKVVKVDENNNLLANAEITLYDLEGNIVENAITDENGLVVFANVPYGEYEVTETKAPEGYNLSEEVLKVSVNSKETGLVYEAGTITNTKIKADIKINKLDQDKNKVIGAEFTLYNSDDVVISTALTKEDGTAVFEDVVYGDYYIKETKTPEGYIGTDEKIEVSVKENNSVYSYEIENTRIKGNLEIKKVDEDGNPLKGAEFTLYNKDGKEISKSISGENGIARFEAVDYGNYVIKETKAPEGYLKEETEVEVVVDSQKTQVFTFKNNKIQDGTDNLGKGGLPSTGSAFDSKLLLIVGLVLVLAGSGFMLKRKVKVNK